MKILKILGIIILVIVLLGLGIIIFGPSSAHVEREIVINAPIETVHAKVSNMKSFNKWSPWFALDEDARYEWEGPSTGTGMGAKIIWYSDNPDVGNGSMEIVEAGETKVTYEMIFDENNDGNLADNAGNPAYASMILSNVDDGTNVRWTFDADNMNGIGKFFALMLEGILGPFYEEGLANLKDRVENRPDFTAKINVQKVEPILYAGTEVTSSNNNEEISDAMEGAYGEIMASLTQNGIPWDSGYPLSVATAYSEESLSMICGMPVPEGTVIESEVVRIQKTPDGTAVRALHFGDYALLEDTHDQISQYAEYYGYEIAGMPWEIYITDPSIEADTTKWLTEVYYPVN